MLYNKTFIIGVLCCLYTSNIWAEVKTSELDELDGNWHLRIMDGMEVRKARTILDFDSEKMVVSGFDGCNQISGALVRISDTVMTSRLTSTKDACRLPIHAYASKRLHETLAEGFNITKTKRNGIEGITLKSKNHELFFKKMGGEDTSSWMPSGLNLDFDFGFNFNDSNDSNQSQ